MYGTVDELGDGRWCLRFSRTFAHPVERVWRAITEPEHLVAWFPTTIEGDRTPGAPLHFTFPGGQAPSFDGEVLVYEPPSVFEFRWGTDVIRLEVHSAERGSTLTLLDTLDERGKAARDAAGWHTCLDALAAALEGHPAARQAMNTWKDVHSHYVRAFGPEGARIGPPQTSA
jgi:uncharacterized protein YndB with AHSA1/START domain